MTDTRDQFRSKNPRSNGVISVVLGVALAAAASLLLGFWAFTGDASLAAPAATLFVLALLGMVIAVLAFRVGAEPASKASLARPLQVTTILVFVVGVGGAVLSAVLAAMVGSFATIGLAVGIGFVAFTVALQGAMVYGTARHEG